MPDDDEGDRWDRIERRGPDNFEIRRVSAVEAMKHLDPAGALARLDLDDHEGMAIRAAFDLIGQMRDPPVTGNAAIRMVLRDYLVGLGYWPAEQPARRGGDPMDM